jgi:hypothetical protein
LLFLYSDRLAKLDTVGGGGGVWENDIRNVISFNQRLIGNCNKRNFTFCHRHHQN